MKLIQGQLQPTAGQISVGVERVCYLDQQVSMLDGSCSVLENFLNFNPNAREIDARFALAQFLFRNHDVLKKVQNLSSGEKLRAALATVLMSHTPPQLLILDEPTNHLDLSSLESIESALVRYEGVLLVISHDQYFLDKIGIDRIFSLT